MTGQALVVQGDALRLPLPDASVDAIVCDPPYGLEFMGQEWDAPWLVGVTGDRPGFAEMQLPDGTSRTLPSYINGRTNPTCRNCGGTQRGQDRQSRRRCQCEAPDFPATKDGRRQMRAYQAWCEQWAAEALRVLKPGGHLLAFGGTRTYHRLASGIEDAGFELRDSCLDCESDPAPDHDPTLGVPGLAWIHGQGFPKNLDVSKAIDKAAGAEREVIGHTKDFSANRKGGFGKSGGHFHDDGWEPPEQSPGGVVTAPATPEAARWQGWGTALKPAFEPIVVARKPLAGTVAQNVLTWGTGALNIDGCRVGHDDDLSRYDRSPTSGMGYGGVDAPTLTPAHPAGRWPPNVILDPETAALLDAQSGNLTSGANPTRRGSDKFRDVYGEFAGQENCQPARGVDSGGASRFMYCAKPDQQERVTVNGISHPTQKPLDLMRWLVRLVTPPQGIVLDPFAGSGTTGEAAMLEHRRSILIEREAAYLPHIRVRTNPFVRRSKVVTNGQPVGPRADGAAVTGAALVVQGDALHLPLPDASVDLIITSPPYFALRAYDAGPGQLGSEPTPQAYLEALWQATAEMARVLKPSGSIFVNLGDKYAGGGGGNYGAGKSVKGREGAHLTNISNRRQWLEASGVRAKSLLLLPERYRIGCVDQTNPYYREQYTRELLYDLIEGEITPEQARAKLAAYDAEPKSKGLGLIARSVTIWGKPNGLPESVTDRVRRSHEDWVHLTKQPRYYAAVDEVREPHAQRTVDQARSDASSSYERKNRWVDAGNRGAWEPGNRNELNPLGKLPGSVWSIPSEPLRLPDHLGVDHYAAFPSEWPRRLILGWSPPGVCVACNQGRWPVVERGLEVDHVEQQTHGVKRDLSEPDSNRRGFNGETWTPGRSSATILGYACACTPHTNHPGTGESSGEGYNRTDRGLADGGYPDAGTNDNGRGHTSLQNRLKVGPWREYHLAGWTPPPTRPAVILDVFGGTGTVAMVARALGRIGISIDLSAAYGRAAKWRIKHDAGKAISRTWTERQGSLL